MGVIYNSTKGCFQGDGLSKELLTWTPLLSFSGSPIVFVLVLGQHYQQSRFCDFNLPKQNQSIALAKINNKLQLHPHLEYKMLHFLLPPLSKFNCIQTALFGQEHCFFAYEFVSSVPKKKQAKTRQTNKAMVMIECRSLENCLS